METKKKKWVIFSIIGLLAFFVGCGKDDDESSSDPALSDNVISDVVDQLQTINLGLNLAESKLADEDAATLESDIKESFALLEIVDPDDITEIVPAVAGELGAAINALADAKPDVITAAKEKSLGEQAGGLIVKIVADEKYKDKVAELSDDKRSEFAKKTMEKNAESAKKLGLSATDLIEYMTNLSKNATQNLDAFGASSDKLPDLMSAATEGFVAKIDDIGIDKQYYDEMIIGVMEGSVAAVPAIPNIKSDQFTAMIEKASAGSVKGFNGMGIESGDVATMMNAATQGVGKGMGNSNFSSVDSSTKQTLASKATGAFTANLKEIKIDGVSTDSYSSIIQKVSEGMTAQLDAFLPKDDISGALAKVTEGITNNLSASGAPSDKFNDILTKAASGQTAGLNSIVVEGLSAADLKTMADGINSTLQTQAGNIGLSSGDLASLSSAVSSAVSENKDNIAPPSAGGTPASYTTEANCMAAGYFWDFSVSTCKSNFI